MSTLFVMPPTPPFSIGNFTFQIAFGPVDFHIRANCLQPDFLLATQLNAKNHTNINSIRFLETLVTLSALCCLCWVEGGSFNHINTYICVCI